MKILLLSFYYAPDLSAGSFRTTSLVKALLEQLPEAVEIDLITTLPNRYQSFSSEAPEQEAHDRLKIRRVKLPPHQSGMADQARAFMSYANKVLELTREVNYALVYGTSSRLMTAALSAYVAKKKSAPLYLDIRDIFVDTIKDVLPRNAAFAARPVFSLLERWTMKRAAVINLVSQGFRDYFQTRYPSQKLSFFTNGIDEVFIAAGASPNVYATTDGPVRVLYAGNMGEGQGLHAIVPELAKRLEGKVTFRLIGDGGRRPQLEQRMRDLDCTNVELLPPVKRDELLREYQNADILFLHLNDYDAFRKVLPSKIFEYAAMGKPVWAGVAGYAAEFLQSEVDNAAVFSPCDVDDAVREFESLKLCDVKRTEFIRKYARENIMRDMAAGILKLLPVEGR
jgi:glycosyltransferase involved in cell wall biosynthesis